MIKKYFAMTVIAASVSLAACSDDDDDDEMAAVTPPTLAECTADPTIDQCDVLFPETQPMPASVDTPAVTAYDAIGNSTDHTALLELLNAIPALANAADDADNPITVLAPDDTAVAAAVSAAGVADTAALITALTTDDAGTADVDESLALSRILSYHVIPGVTALADGVAADTALVDDGTAIQITPAASGTAASGLAVTDQADTPVTADLAEAFNAAGGVVYTLGSVLTPPAAPVTPVSGGTGTFATLVGSDYSIAVAALDAAFGAGTFDNAAWTLFLPSDATLAAQSPAVTSMTAEDINGHLHTAALDEAALAAVIAANGGAGSVLSANNNGNNAAATIAVTDDAGDGSGATLVGGFTVTYVGEVAADATAGTTGGAQVYAIDGVLPAVQ